QLHGLVWRRPDSFLWREPGKRPAAGNQIPARSKKARDKSRAREPLSGARHETLLGAVHARQRVVRDGYSGLLVPRFARRRYRIPLRRAENPRGEWLAGR